MDLKFIFRVLRHRWVTITFGIVVASVAALLAGYRVSSDGLESREVPEYEAVSRLIVSTPDRSVFASGSIPTIGPDGRVVEVQGGYDPNELADIYAFLVVSDDLRPLIEGRHGPLVSGDSISAQRRHTGPDAPNDPEQSSVLPILEITARSRTAEGAQTLAVDTSQAFTGYIASQQAVQNIPPQLRVEVRPLELPDGASNKTGKNTGTIALVFAAIAAAFVALAFARENSARTAALAAEPTRWINVVVPIDNTTATAGLQSPTGAIAPVPKEPATDKPDPPDEPDLPYDYDDVTAATEPALPPVAETFHGQAEESDSDSTDGIDDIDDEADKELVSVDATGGGDASGSRLTTERPKPRRRWPRHRTR